MTTTEPSDDIHALELDFNKHPNTDAFVPLCEAYLRQKRYMEAMLVCKKGIKNLPNDPRGRLLLAKVYFSQGKPPKAEQELQSLLEAFPDNVDALVMQGEIFKQAGRKSDAINSLQRALMMQPGRADLKDSLRGLGVEPDAAPPPPPMQQQMQMANMTPMQQMQQQQMMMMQQQGMPPPAPQQTQMGVDSFFDDQAPTVESFSPAQDAQQQNRPRKKKKKGSGKITLAIVAVLIVGFGTFLGFYINHVNNVKKIDVLVREARPSFDRASYVGYKAALDKYKQILEIDPKNTFGLSISAYVHYTLSAGQMVTESAPLAESFLQQAEAAGKPQDENQYRIASRGWQKIAAGDPKGAADYIDVEAPKAQAIHVYVVQAEAHAALGNDAMARDAMTKAAGISASDIIVLVRTGEMNIDDAKYDNAKGYFDQALAVEVGHPGAMIGRVYSNIGKKIEALDQAEKDLEKLAITPAEYMTPRWKAGVSWAKGLLDLRQGKALDAQKNFDDALKLDPQNMRNLQLRAKVYSVMNMWPEAVKDYQAVLAKKPSHRPSQVGLALAYSTLGKSVEAGQIVDTLLAKDPNDAELQLVKARSLKTQGKYDDAIAAYQKVLTLQKTNFDAKVEIGHSLRLKKDMPKAIEHFTALAAEAKGRNNAIANMELGRTLFEQGSADKAKEALIAAFTKDPDFPDTYFWLGKAAKGPAKKEAFNQYLKLAPTGPYAAEATKLKGK